MKFGRNGKNRSPKAEMRNEFMMTHKSRKNAYISLYYGEVMPLWTFVVFCMCASTCILLIVLSVILFATDIWEIKIFSSVVGVCSLFTVLLSMLIIVELPYRINIYRWEKDAEICSARIEYVDRIYNQKLGRGELPHGWAYRIKVTFEYCGEQKEIYSGRPGHTLSNSKFPKVGYCRLYGKYIGKTVDILYAPSYDQVLLPKVE